MKKSKNIKDLRKDIKALEKREMKKVVGGKKKIRRSNKGFSGIVPQ